MPVGALSKRASPSAVSNRAYRNRRIVLRGFKPRLPEKVIIRRRAFQARKEAARRRAFQARKGVIRRRAF